MTKKLVNTIHKMLIEGYMPDEIAETMNVPVDMVYDAESALVDGDMNYLADTEAFASTLGKY